MNRPSFPTPEVDQAVGSQVLTPIEQPAETCVDHPDIEFKGIPKRKQIIYAKSLIGLVVSLQEAEKPISPEFRAELKAFAESE
jgi:hypothetical protein